MRVLQVIPSFPPTKAFTGPPAAVYRLCVELIALGVDVEVATTNTDGNDKLVVPSDSWIEYKGVPVFYGNRWGWRGDISPSLYRCIQHRVPAVDLVHATAIFSWPLIRSASACKKCHVPLIVSPRGSLDRDALLIHRTRKQLFMALGGDGALRGAKAFHVTSGMEKDHVLKLFPGAKTAVVPNGVDIPVSATLEGWKGEKKKNYILYLGRLHPKKNLSTLLHAWSRITTQRGEAQLFVAGPDEGGVRRQLEALCGRLGIEGYVRFLGWVEGETRGRLLSQAKALVLPSITENFGNVVVEGLAHGVPVVASTGTPWQGLIKNRCGWWVGADESSLADAISEVLAMPECELSYMGRRGREWVARDYAWPAVAAQMKELYEETIEMARVKYEDN